MRRVVVGSAEFVVVRWSFFVGCFFVLRRVSHFRNTHAARDEDDDCLVGVRNANLEVRSLALSWRRVDAQALDFENQAGSSRDLGGRATVAVAQIGGNLRRRALTCHHQHECGADG